MVEFIPFLLLILAAPAGEGERITVERVEGLFANVAECEAEGAQIIARRAGGAAAQYRCLPAPHPREYDAAWRRVTGSGE